ncbi:hypothetical protein AMAG_10440 [Allomyces macrogynus ATCC 38327]|uniref:Carbohydrate-binding module family 19 domain-containing protein n=1 Tax=Allomyces macrogynus (strain ATCC 38327) TaxID=578462 RepID=A0A0L0SUC8_ALLM3|nr:hypothetical protein AMAG_10440 [Allomyces macrogynus ATCC 38327]|eukprot:KNE66198.1 hypothetical protein AMAG_10440 [Allomyces macrogynus ATCC 38327]
MKLQLAPLFALLPAAAIARPAQVGDGADFRTANKVLAAKLDGGKAALQVGSPCPMELDQEGAIVCAGNQLARCIGEKVAGPFQSCAVGLSCQVLPLVSKPGVSVMCDTDADKVARIGTAAGAGTGVGTPAKMGDGTPAKPDKKSTDGDAAGSPMKAGKRGKVQAKKSTDPTTTSPADAHIPTATAPETTDPTATDPSAIDPIATADPTATAAPMGDNAGDQTE